MNRSRNVLEFLYPIAPDIQMRFSLLQWHEFGYYLSGVHDGEELFFRKDAATFLGGCEQLLSSPFVAAPPLPSVQQRLIEIQIDGLAEDKNPEAYHALLAKVRDEGFAVYTAQDKPSSKNCEPGFLLRTGVTKNLSYYFCHPSISPDRSKINALKARKHEDKNQAGEDCSVIVQSTDAFIDFLKTGFLPVLEPYWKSRRIEVTAPFENSDGYLNGWAFLLGRWFYSALDLKSPSVAVPYWTQTEVPNFSFSDGDVLNCYDYSVTLQVESAMKGFHGVVVMKRFDGNRPAGYFRCQQHALVKTLQDGNLARLNPILNESAVRIEKMRAEADLDYVGSQAGAGKEISSSPAVINLSFLYRKADGVEEKYELSNWKEQGRYLVATTPAGPRTFRKDRVVEYYGNVKAMLTDPDSIAPPPPKPKMVSHIGPQILFTGYSQAERDRLEALASSNGMTVVKSVTQSLSYLCGGPNAGPSKVEQAREKGVWILNAAALGALLQTGELPDEDVNFA
ncbi:BRCT domain-containing protein [Chromobacterium sphagni]|uniref:BRCT domain-containing protein n=1 Tax=Chromobacterium sphagni TaxID=1903179 RepID=UPI000ADE6800|nr:BRCT domain-containing protein [Chromobacterium sphagni]